MKTTRKSMTFLCATMLGATLVSGCEAFRSDEGDLDAPQAPGPASVTPAPSPSASVAQ